MTGWLEYAIFIGATTAVTIIVKKLKCKYNENSLTVEMIVEVTRRASQSHIKKIIITECVNLKKAILFGLMGIVKNYKKVFAGISNEIVP